MTEFSGFPRQYFTLFNQLKKNNTREWFEEHRSDYDEFVLNPTREFVIAMGEKLRKIAPGVNAIPKINQSLFKINRDVRFSKDKSPLRIAAHFNHRGTENTEYNLLFLIGRYRSETQISQCSLCLCGEK